MGILNMMIVVPMLIQTLTFGWIFENLLDSRGTNAILLAGALLGCAALAMLWVNPPQADEESTRAAAGGRREITVYDRVVVGSDGSPSALYAVARAHEVAAAAEAQDRRGRRLRPGRRAPAARAGRTVASCCTARRRPGRPCSKSVPELTSDRIRDIEQVVVAGKPAEALLRVAGSNPASLIVVGNRGLGAQEGEVLGSVPARDRAERRLRRARWSRRRRCSEEV